MTLKTAKIIPDSAKRVIEFPLHPVAQLVHGADLDANFSLFDVDIPARAPGAPPHTHAHEDEVYYILSGAVSFLLGDRVETAMAGSTVILPRGIMHATWNAGDSPARALTFVSQDSRFETFFDDVVGEIRARGVTDPMEMGAIVGEIGAGRGVVIDMDAMPEEAKPLFGMA